ncbi:MAG: hypothetical protein FWD14_00830 [Treponema sp.]|nr:hypothetical protein [Treponema sp.]
MINNYFKKTISFFLAVIFISGLFPPFLYTQQNPSSFPEEIKGFNKAVFENSFSKADREVNSDRWFAEAKMGLSQAIGAWELIAGSLYDDPYFFEQAKNQLEKWTSEELEKRFSSWLIRRFFGVTAENAMISFSAMLGNTQKFYSWHLDENGNVLFDPVTGDPMIIRPNDENRDFYNDLILWQEEADRHVKNIMVKYFPELLAYIPAELRSVMSAVIDESASIKSSIIKKEFENIAAREERIFLNRRTRDVWSLRNKSENEAARLFTAKLIAETEEICKIGIEDLNSKIEQAAAGTGDLAIMGEEWLRLYKDQFDRGLRAWEEAEERFFIRRIEWEQDSFRLFLEGEEIWHSAFKQFEEERQKWELSVKELFLAGEMLFISISEEFEKNISEAKKEFELNMTMRIGEGTARVKALIDIYLISSSAAISAKENMQFWKDNNNTREMQKSNDMYNMYMETALEMRERILADYAELFGTGALKDILSSDASSEDFYLDEYQIALVRAKALVLYWERKTLISQAVMNYADELSAGRMTESEGITAWEKAKTAYNDSLFLYEAELEKLNILGVNLKEQQEVLFNLSELMKKEEEVLRRLNNEYKELVSFSAVNLENYYFAALNAKFNYLADEYLFFQKEGDESEYKNILEYGMLWGLAEAKDSGYCHAEMWNNINNSLFLLFDNYSISAEKDYLPDIHFVLQAILEKPGDAEENAVNFAIEFESCFIDVPKWLEIEIVNWVNALLNLVFIQSQDLTETNNNWRQYIPDDFFADKDLFIEAASSKKDGYLADLLFNAAYFTNRVNDALKIFSHADVYNASETADYYFSFYYTGLSELAYRFQLLDFLYNEITDTARAYEYAKMSPDETRMQLLAKENELREYEGVYNTLKNDYFQEADKFNNIGFLYDNQYSMLKKAYEYKDLKRYEYEMQDAIRRWAATSYLNTDNINLANNREKLQKAQTVLNVLSDLYKNDNVRTFNDPVYNDLYLAYEQCFRIKLNVLEAVEAVTSAAMQERMNNMNLFNSYQNALYQLGYIDQNYNNYISSGNRTEWSLKDIITVIDGRIVFSKDDSLRLSGIDETKAKDIELFFNSNAINNDERYEITLFEESLRGLSERMSGYLTDGNKYRQWSYARNHLILSLSNANGDLGFLRNQYTGLSSLEGVLDQQIVTNVDYGRSRVRTIREAIGYEHIFINAENMFRDAWNGLNKEEQADLEFYLILTLSGIGNNYLSGFSQMYARDAGNYIDSYVNDIYTYALREQKKAWSGTTFDTMVRTNRVALRNIYSPISTISNTAQRWVNGLSGNLLLIKNNAGAYNNSSVKLQLLEGNKSNSHVITWDDINLTLITANKLKEENILQIKASWEKFSGNTNNTFTSVPAALNALLVWTNNEEIAAKSNLEKYWIFIADNQNQNESNFLTAVDSFIAGTIDIGELKNTAQKAYGENTASWKNHLNIIHSVLLSDISMNMEQNFNFISEFGNLGAELTLLTAKTIENRYMSELTAREAEWNQMFADILDKYFEWQNSAALILENGRMDWITGIQRIEASFREWQINFQNEYERVSDEWARVYLAGLEDKEIWLQQAANAANQASSNSFLSLMGAEGERLSRFIDTREPFGIRDSVPEAQALLSELLQFSGISKMSNAFSSINNIANTSSAIVKRGLGNVSVWNAALDKTAASDLARKTNAEIADNETRKLAYSAKLAANEAITGLTANVEAANNNFRENMDNIFIFNGLWSKNGSNYVKSIMKGSTLFDPVITETVTISGYINFNLGSVSLKTNMDENYLSSLNSIAIRVLLENVYSEVQAIADEIFGIGKDPISINRDRMQSPGRFGAHIGYSPANKPSDQMGNRKGEMFYDEGAGELGRLMSEFTYWSIIDTKGYSELSMAPWEKRMWNDDGSWFTSPSLRTVGTIACSIAAGALTGGTGFAGIALVVGINSSSEILFSSLDVAYGYKTLDEAGFNMGKTILSNSISSIGGGLFGGLSDKAFDLFDNTFYKVASKTLMTGAQTASISLATSAINGITYTSGGNWGYNANIFNAGFNSLYTNTLTSMAGSFVTTSLTALNTGFNSDKLDGFSNKNKQNLLKLNDLAGSLAGQGVNYALGNDFTLNVFNLGIFGKEKLSSGLLELNLGRSGVNMNIGTGGANVGINNLIASFNGAQVWNVNSKINKYIKEQGKESGNGFVADIALRAQYGYGNNDQKNQLRDILKGDVLLNTNADGDFYALSTRSEGKRIIDFAGYEKNMSREEQFRLAVILGHEAYRDGYGVGEIDTSGKIVTDKSNFDELKEASIARILMGDRIQAEHDWFYSYNADFDLENYFYLNALSTGDFSMFDDYLKLTYQNDKDYFFLPASTGSNYQNEERYRNIPLLNGASQERVNQINEERKQAAYNKYVNELSEGSVLIGWEEFRTNASYLKENGYEALNFISLHTYGCRFMSTKYALEALTGKTFNALQLQDFARDNKLYSSNTLLSSQNMADIITKNTDGLFSVSPVNAPEKPSLEELFLLNQSNTMYLACLKIKGHFVMLSEIDFIIDSNGNPTGISEIRAANPWNSSGDLGRQKYNFSDIDRWDIFMVTPTSGSNYSVVENAYQAFLQDYHQNFRR